MSAFTHAELSYLAAQPLGRLATVRKDGSPQNNPVAFSYNAEQDTIDIGGFHMATTRKWRNVAANGLVAFVVDDVVTPNPWTVRCLEIRGTAEALATGGAMGDGALVRIHPARILSYGVDHAHPGWHNRDL